MKTATLVTGICASGKTHYAAERGVPSLSYDSIRNYPAKTTDYAAARRWAKKHAAAPDVTIDAWDFVDDPDLSLLRGILGDSRRIEIKYLYLTPLALHIAQLGKHAQGHVKLEGIELRTRGHTTRLAREMKQFTQNVLRRLAAGGTSVQWLFRAGVTVTTHDTDDHLLSLVHRDPCDELLAWVDAVSGDPNYQSIELEGELLRPGYMTSHLLWRQVQGLDIHWRDTTVYDLGCFNGYFSFAAEREGAGRVVGYDCDQAAGRVFARLALLQHSDCEFVDADLSKGLPPGDTFDIALLLNSLHHITANSADGGSDFLDGVFIRAQQVIATVNPDQVALLRSVAARTGHYSRMTRPQDTCNVTGQGSRKLLHFSETPDWI